MPQKHEWRIEAHSVCVICRIAVFSITVLHDERIVVVAEQRPDSTEEDSFQWMSRVLQVNAHFILLVWLFYHISCRVHLVHISFLCIFSKSKLYKWESAFNFRVFR